MRRRILSVVLCLCLTAALLPAVTLPARASTNGHSQADAVAWTKSQIGKYLDYDKKYGCQCWDLAKYYYVYLGSGKYCVGNATNFVSNQLPPGWTRDKNPRPGDLCVWKGGSKGAPRWTVSKYGHIGIVIAVNSNGTVTTVEQNIHGSACKKTTRTTSYVSCFIHPDFTPVNYLSIQYNANGGEVTNAQYGAGADGMIQTGGANVVTKWASGTGGPYGLYNASSFGLVREGRVFAGWSLDKDGGGIIFDQDDTSLTADQIYPAVKNASAAVTLYAVWEQAMYNLATYLNYSGKNYFFGSDFASGVDGDWWKSRDESVAVISADETETHNGYSSLKIVNTAAGANGKDLAFGTMLPGNHRDENYVPDERTVTLSFWGKASAPGAVISFRWGFDPNYSSVTLTEDWAFYTLVFDRAEPDNAWLHPYVDRAGTVWLSELQLEDGDTATEFVPENGGLYQTCPEPGGHLYALPEPPTRDGYTFDGWYTHPDGGEEITTDTPVKSGNLRVFAQWTEGHSHEYAPVETVEPTCTAEGYTVWVCQGCGDTILDNIEPVLGHAYVDGVCASCGEIDPDYTGEADPTLDEDTEGAQEEGAEAVSILSAEADETSVLVKVDGAPAEGTVIAAVYNGSGKMLASGVRNLTGAGEYTIEMNTAGGNTVSVFLLDEGQKPLCRSFSGPV